MEKTVSRLRSRGPVLLALFLLLGTGARSASSDSAWVRLHVDPAGVTEIDPGTVGSAEDGIVEARLRRAFHHPRVLRDRPYDHVMVVAEYDCVERAVRIVEGALYDGRTLVDAVPFRGEWRPVAAETPAETVWRHLCREAGTRSASR